MFKISEWLAKRFKTKINPIKINGNWHEGYALDLHTLESEFAGYGERCQKVFDTSRTDVGELLYRLKYRFDKSVLPKIIRISVNFIKNEWQIDNLMEGIVPIPPSKIFRDYQPVQEMAKGISFRLKTPFHPNSLKKKKETPQLKKIFNFNERFNILRNVFIADRENIAGKNLLLFDDLFTSGATLTAATAALYQQGQAEKIYAFVLTKTRSKS